jgi:uncharacterized protein YfdQ (DUF2303 family)
MSPLSNGRYAEGDDVTTDTAVVADLAAQALGVVAEEGRGRVVIVPAGARAEIVDLTPFALTPWRPKGTARPQSVEAFIDYVRRHQRPTTTIWVEPLDGKVVAVLNDHGPDQDEEFGDFRAELALPVTPEWKHWMSRDKRYGSQTEFAEHIEEGLDEIRDPPGALLLEIAQSMQATVTAEFKSASRLDDGSIAVQWVEDINASAGRAGDLMIPQEITLGIAPFYGEQPYELLARIRYRIGHGELSIGYSLNRPDTIIRDCLLEIRSRIEEAFPGQVFIGSPPTGHR